MTTEDQDVHQGLTATMMIEIEMATGDSGIGVEIGMMTMTMTDDGGIGVEIETMMMTMTDDGGIGAEIGMMTMIAGDSVVTDASDCDLS